MAVAPVAPAVKTAVVERSLIEFRLAGRIWNAWSTTPSDSALATALKVALRIVLLLPTLIAGVLDVITTGGVAAHNFVMGRPSLAWIPSESKAQGGIVAVVKSCIDRLRSALPA